MLSRVASSRKNDAGGAAGRRAYVVGDIHGRLDLLDALLVMMEADSVARGPVEVSVVFLGDLIDRGPQSAEVVERLRRYRPAFATPVFLMGNHEEVLLRILGGDTAILPDWLRFGGAECARSYGVDPVSIECSSPAAALKLLRRAVPKSHVKFLSGFADSASFGDYLFVHAGIRPGIPLAHQSPQDLRWIRYPFLEDETDHGRIVVHGHTISETAEMRPNRIGIDTGAYRTGVLTALGLEGPDRWLLQTGREASLGEGDRVAKFRAA